MKGPNMSDEELERKLRTFFRQEAANVEPPKEWWDAALSNLGEQQRPRRRLLPRLRLPAFFPNLTQLPPLPITASAGLALMLVASALVFAVIGPGMGRESQLGAPSWDAASPAEPTPSPVPAAPAMPGGSLGRDRITSGSGFSAEGAEGPVVRFHSRAMDFAATSAGEETDGGGDMTIRMGISVESVAAGCEGPTDDILRESDFAFDGTVAHSMLAGDGAYRLLFEVERWYRGGDARFVSALVEAPSSAVVPGLAERRLIAGQRDDTGRATSDACGLMQPYTEEGAREWEALLGP